MNIEKGSLRFITSGNNLSLNKSKKVLDPEQYLDPSLLAVKGNFILMQYATGVTRK